MQAQKGIINFVYDLPEKPSSLWQVQCVMFLVTLNKPIMHMQKAYQRLMSLLIL